jgi:hypothetical protein
MLARLRCLGTGAVLGVGLHRVHVALQEDPDLLRDVTPQRVRDALRSMMPGESAPPGGEEATGDKDLKKLAEKKTVALIRMSGTIAAPSSSPLANKGSINLANYEQQLSSAFRAPGTAAVAIEINSPACLQGSNPRQLPRWLLHLGCDGIGVESAHAFAASSPARQACLLSHPDRGQHGGQRRHEPL